MNHTQKYQLSQWESTDRILMEDFNNDNAKLETALSALSAASARHGNCSVSSFVYTGTGTSGKDNPTVVKFPKMPAAYIIQGEGLMIGWGGSTSASTVYDNTSYAISSKPAVTWSGTTLSFHAGNASGQMNELNKEYRVIAFYIQ